MQLRAFSFSSILAFLKGAGTSSVLPPVPVPIQPGGPSPSGSPAPGIPGNQPPGEKLMGFAQVVGFYVAQAENDPQVFGVVVDT